MILSLKFWYRLLYRLSRTCSTGSLSLNGMSCRNQSFHEAWWNSHHSPNNCHVNSTLHCKIRANISVMHSNTVDWLNVALLHQLYDIQTVIISSIFIWITNVTFREEFCLSLNHIYLLFTIAFQLQSQAVEVSMASWLRDCFPQKTWSKTSIHCPLEWLGLVCEYKCA